MTTFYEKKVLCSVCGGQNVFIGVRSTNAFGSADLDTRPPKSQRYTISTWVQRCPNCGYCASDVSVTRLGAQVVVSGKEYSDQMNDPTYPELANSFLCKAIVDRELKDFAAAAWALIHAAWACDDDHHPDQATACRQKAADMLKIAEEHGQQVADQDGDSTAILVDLLRRSGQIEQASKVIAARRSRITQDTIARILDFQSALLDKNDLYCHTIAEALGEEGGGEQTHAGDAVPTRQMDDVRPVRLLMGDPGMIRPARVMAIILNVLLLAGIVYKVINDAPVDQRGWIWLAIFLGCPTVNLLGLSGVVNRIFTVIATIFNCAAILVWGGLIALMMVWPLGNKPKGIEVVVLVGSWLVLILTEVVLVRMAKSKTSEELLQQDKE